LVSILAVLQAGQLGFNAWQEQGELLPCHCVQIGSGAHTAPEPMGTGGYFSGGGVVHLDLVPKSRMYGAIPPLPQYVFMVWYLVKHRDNFTFL